MLRSVFISREWFSVRAERGTWISFVLASGYFEMTVLLNTDSTTIKKKKIRPMYVSWIKNMRVKYSWLQSGHHWNSLHRRISSGWWAVLVLRTDRMGKKSKPIKLSPVEKLWIQKVKGLKAKNVMAKGMDSFTWICVQFETSWRTSQRFTCMGIRLPLNHAPSMNL